MKIKRLQAERFKRIRAVDIEPDGTVVLLRGENAQGKSSVLDAVASVLGGKGLCPEVPIKHGEKDARVAVELDDGLIAERRWWRSGSEVRTELEVRAKDGVPLSSPQKVLDALVGKISFDPLAFSRMDGPKQAEMLRKIAGVDLTTLDARRATAYEARKAANRDVEQLRAKLSGPEIEAPDAPLSSADLLAEQKKRMEGKAANDRRRTDLENEIQKFKRQNDDVARAKARVADLEKQLADARAALTASETKLEEMRTAGKALKAEVQALVDPNLDEILAKLKDIDAVNDRVREKQKRATLRTELAAAEAKADGFDTEIKAVDDLKAATLAKAKFPVDGLGFSDAGGVTFDRLPFEQASQAQRLRVSVAIAIATNPKLPVMLVRDGSVLDKKGIALLHEMAEAAGAQVWLEMVGSEGAGIVIEDGSVTEAARG